MNKKALFILVWFMFFLANLAQAQSKIKVKQATPDDFQLCIDSCLQYLIIDVRDSTEDIQALIPKSLWLPTKEALLKSIDTLDRDMPILIYCSYGVRSQAASQVLIDNGFTQVIHLKKGIDAWQKANKPVLIIIKDKQQ
ncbi:MAG: rhodanese-like domain-containing protein [Salinivirgaceae bacterium]